MDTLVVILTVVFIYRVTHYIFTEPISCPTADMLPIIRGAGERLISFQSPFNMTFCPTYGGPFPYLPIMMVYYLPGIIFRMDIRIVSLIFCLGLLLLGYIYYRKKGYRLTGFLIFVILTTSVLLPLFLITVHTFPYLFVLAVLLLAFNEDNDKVMFFSLALALASRKFFWLYLPFFVIYIFKSRKFSLSSIKYFVLGGILGLVPYILFPSDFIRSNVLHVANANIDAIPDLHLQHSIGLTPFSFHHRTLSLIVLVVLYGLTCVLALKYLNKKNTWAFLSLSTLIFLYFQVSTRTQEYYFLPLIAFLLFAPLEDLMVKWIYPVQWLSRVVSRAEFRLQRSFDSSIT